MRKLSMLSVADLQRVREAKQGQIDAINTVLSKTINSEKARQAFEDTAYELGKEVRAIAAELESREGGE